MKQKWRPRLRSIIVTTLAIALLLPLSGLLFFRIYETQLVQQTEAELIAQSAAISAIFSREILDAQISPDQMGVALKEKQTSEPYQPIEAQLDLARNKIQPPRPDPITPSKPIDPKFESIGLNMLPIILETQKTTLAGFRLTDPFGVVIAGKSEVGQSLASIEEIKQALQGEFQAVLRVRISDSPPPPLYSISRGTKIRVFTAMPVIVKGHVAGVVYASRTPNNIIKHLYTERWSLFFATLAVLAITAMLGYVVSRTLTGPLLELTDRTRKIVAGDKEGMKPLKNNGTREMAELSQSILTMAQRLQNRSDQISIFATHVSHELKSPLSAIQGAAELIRDQDVDMDPTQRKKFLDNIIEDTGRLNVLVRKLLELAKAQSLSSEGETSNLDQALKALGTHYGLHIHVSTEPNLLMSITADNLAAIIGALADNAAKHGATALTIKAATSNDMIKLTIADNGNGVSHSNAGRMFDLFFTTRREEGGTGMGLGIVRAMLQAHNGSIAHIPTNEGTKFQIMLPRAQD